MLPSSHNDSATGMDVPQATALLRSAELLAVEIEAERDAGDLASRIETAPVERAARIGAADLARAATRRMMKAS